MNTIKEIQKINDEELERGIAGTSASWHSKYKSSSWVYVGNLDHALTEGDILCVLSQFGELEDLHLIRDEETGKSKGFAFCKYEDARSCVLAVDNLIGIQVSSWRCLRGLSGRLLDSIALYTQCTVYPLSVCVFNSSVVDHFVLIMSKTIDFPNT